MTDEFYDDLKRIVRDRDGMTCRICGKRYRSPARAQTQMTAQRVDRWKPDTLDNLVLGCRIHEEE